MRIQVVLLGLLFSTHVLASELRFEGVDSRQQKPCTLTLTVDDATGKVTAFLANGTTRLYMVTCLCSGDIWLDDDMYSIPDISERFGAEQTVNSRGLSLVIDHTASRLEVPGSFVARLKVKGYPNEIEEFTWKRTLRVLGVRITQESMKCVDLRQVF